MSRQGPLVPQKLAETENKLMLAGHWRGTGGSVGGSARSLLTSSLPTYSANWTAIVNRLE